MSVPCRLIIDDHVNCHFEGLGFDTRAKIFSTFGYMTPGARFNPAYVMGSWDGMVHLVDAHGRTQINVVTERMLEIISKAGHVLEIDDRREPITSIPTPVTEDYLPGLTARGWKLRDYQIEAANIAIAERCGMFVMGTGSGKTLTCAALARKFSQNGRVLVIVPSTQLVDQTADEFEAAGVESVGRFHGEEKVIGTVQIATWQSMAKYPEIAEAVQCVIVDESHGADAATLFRLLTVACRNVPFRFGFTGTMPKEPCDAERIFAAIGPVRYTLPSWKLQEIGVLSSCHVTVLRTVEGKRKFGSYQDEKAFLCNDLPRLEFCASTIKAISESGNTLVLVENIETGRLLQSMIGDSAIFMSGQTGTKRRKKEFASIATQDGRIFICTAGVAAVGIDAPRLFNIVLFELGKAFVRVIQAIGRVLRKEGDKNHGDIYDICATTKYSTRHLSERKKHYEEARYPFTIEEVDYLGIKKASRR